MKGCILLGGLIVLLITASFGTTATNIVSEECNCPELIIKNDKTTKENTKYSLGLIDYNLPKKNSN